MKFDDFISTAKVLGKGREVWLTNETFNELDKAKFVLNRNDNLIICSGDIEIEISIKAELDSKCLTSVARIERVSEVFPSTRMLKGDIYISPKTSQKFSIIL